MLLVCLAAAVRAQTPAVGWQAKAGPSNTVAWPDTADSAYTAGQPDTIGPPDTAGSPDSAGLPDKPDSPDTSGQPDTTGPMEKAGPPDSLRTAAPVPYLAPAPDPGTEFCRETLESAAGCFRGHGDLYVKDNGFSGAREGMFHRATSSPVPLLSPYLPAQGYSPYGSGGLMRPWSYRLEGGAVPEAVYELWEPVMPLDTPVTRLHWTRGALEYNQFHFNLERLLAGRTYLGLDYFSNSADSLVYDYPFQVHQPYLNGWMFLGDLYAPIDRDSASLVIRGRSHRIEASHFRPRLGYWFDSARVAEIFFDRFHNSTSLARPYNPLDNDSVQALLPSSFTGLSAGAVYAERADEWLYEIAYRRGTFAREEPAKSGEGTGGTLEGAVDVLGGRFYGRRLPGRPLVELEMRNELLDGELFLQPPGKSGPMSHGWSDHQTLKASMGRSLGQADLRLGLEGGRHSQMNGEVQYVWGQSARIGTDLPFGLTAHAGEATRGEAPDSERLFRHNPMLSLYPSPGLEPRRWRSANAGLIWRRQGFTLGAGADIHRIAGSWQPRILPSMEACAELRGGTYRGLDPGACDPFGEVVPDSLALGLVNYGSEARDSWYWSAGFALGNWNLLVRHTYLFHAVIEDASLGTALQNRGLPRSLNQGHLVWGRSLVQDRLGVAVRWDWEWLSARDAWAPQGDGSSRLVRLDEYLALDFEARMRIKSFTLFYRIKNLNHDRYAPEPGVHPPGVNFRFGVDWTMRN